MLTVNVQDLVVGNAVDRDLYHESGVEVFHTGHKLTKVEKDLLLKHGIANLHRAENEDDLLRFVRQATNLLMAVENLSEEKALSRPLFDSTGQLLLKENLRVTRALKDKLKGRNINTVHIKKSAEERRLEQLERYRAELAQHQEPSAPAPAKVEEAWDKFEDLDEEDYVRDPETISVGAMDKNVENLLHVGAVKTDPLLDQLVKVDPEPLRSREVKAGYEGTYREAIQQFFGMLGDLRANRAIDGEGVGRISKALINRMVQDRTLLLNLTHMKTPENYDPNHAVNVVTLSISIGTAMGLGKKQVLELAHAAFLHDVGMLKVPPVVLSKPGKLTAVERMEIDRHPIHGLNMLQHVRTLPTAVPIVVYQEHERMNKSGYPRQRAGPLIHRYARIVAVADVYDALTSPRPWRPALLPYEAMEGLLRLVSKKALDAEVMRAFLSFAGLFPVGSYVRLSDSSLAKVVQANPKRFTKPKVRVLSIAGQILAEPEYLDLMRSDVLEVVQPVSPTEIPGTALQDGF